MSIGENRAEIFTAKFFWAEESHARGQRDKSVQKSSKVGGPRLAANCSLMGGLVGDRFKLLTSQSAAINKLRIATYCQFDFLAAFNLPTLLQ